MKDSFRQAGVEKVRVGTADNQVASRRENRKDKREKRKKRESECETAGKEPVKGFEKRDAISGGRSGESRQEERLFF